MVNQFCNNFVEVIEGTGEGMVSTDQLSVGAKINRLFHERLPLHIGRKKMLENTYKSKNEKNRKFCQNLKFGQNRKIKKNRKMRKNRKFGLN